MGSGEADTGGDVGLGEQTGGVGVGGGHRGEPTEWAGAEPPRIQPCPLTRAGCRRLWCHLAEPVPTNIVGGTWPRGVGFMHGLKMLARCGSGILLEAGLQRRGTWGAQLDLLGSCMGQWEPWLGTVCTVGGCRQVPTGLWGLWEGSVPCYLPSYWPCRQVSATVI